MRRSETLIPTGLLFTLLLIVSGTTPRAQTRSAADPNGVGATRSNIPFHRLDPGLQGKALHNYGNLALSFEINHGQTDSRVKFLTRGSGYTLFLTGDESVLGLKGRQLSVFSRQSGTREQGSGVRGKAKIENRTPNPEQAKDEGQRTKDSILTMKLVGSSPQAAITGIDELPGKSNYFIGNDPAKWRTNVPTYAKVKYANVYPGVDLIYYGNQGQLEYDFVVAPSADPGVIRLALDGYSKVGSRHSAVGSQSGNSKLENRKSYRGPDSRFPTPDSLHLAANGDLIVNLDGGEVRFHKPVIYQPSPTSNSELRTEKLPVEGRYRLAGNQVRFEIGRYDQSRPLVIDPALSYSSFLGGSGTDAAFAVAVDASGEAYVTGYTASTDFPVTAGDFQATYGGGFDDAFVAKVNAAGSALLYSTYLGGSQADIGNGITFDSSGNAYVTGSTGSPNFPTTPGVYEPNCGSDNCGTDSSFAFVTKLNPTGSALVYSTYLGGTGSFISAGGAAIAVDASGNAYVTGENEEKNFPTTPGVFQPACHGVCQNAFVSKFNSTASALIYSSYLGGDEEDYAQGIALDSAGNAYLAGETDSPDFPVTPGAFQTTYAGGVGGFYGDGFVTKVNPGATALVYSTYLGGSSSDQAMGIQVNTAGESYVTGFTSSTDFPVTAGAFETTCTACADSFYDAFLTKLNSAGSALVYSTFLGGSIGAAAYGIALDSSGDAYVTGGTDSTDFPVTPGAFQTTNPVNGGVSFITELNPSGSGLRYSTYFGGSLGQGLGNGIALDPSNEIYVVGETVASNFPVTAGAFQTSCGGGCTSNNYDGFLTKFGPGDQVYPLSLNFGNQTVGTASAPLSTTLSNSGSTALSITSIAVTANNGSFAETNTCGSSLAAGATCSITLTWTPSAAGAMTGTIAITDTASNSPQTVTLTGTGNEPAVTVSAASLTFPTQVVFTSSRAQNVTLTNTGTGTLAISSIVATGGEFSETNTCGTTVAPGTNCTISVTFAPKAKGTLGGTVTITDNAPHSPQKIRLSGCGTFVQLSRGTLNFGNQPVGTTSPPQSVTMSNKGDSAVSITGISISGSDPADFSVADNCGSSLAAGASCVFNVSFTPGQQGKRTAVLSIDDNGGCSPQSIGLSGTGTP
jgi:hypothetical protein